MHFNIESFNIGDHVYASDWCEGIIVEINHKECVAYVSFDTGNIGGCLPFGLDELEHVPERKATLEAFKTVHGTVNVVVQNCSSEVVTLLHRFDVWKSDGKYKYDENKPKERAKIWFECPIEFLDFVESSMGKAAFQRMGVEEFYINH